MFAEIARDMADEEAGNGSEPNSQEVQCGSQTSGSTGSSGLSVTIQKEAASRSLQKIGLSPLATNIRRKQGMLCAAKSKIDAAANIIRKKVCRAYDIDPEELESTDAMKAKDHDLLMDQIKEKLPSASKIQTYQLLSLVPLSMSINKAAVQFGVGRTVVSNSRKLRIEKGILPIPDFTRESSVLESTKILVKEFYCREENCKILPGSRDCVSVGKGVYEQKRLLLSNLSELYASFKQEYEGLKIGITTFVSLRPKWCIFAGSAGTHEQCICQIHQNFKLVLHALNIRKHYRDLMKLCVCSLEDRTCMLKICETCPNLEKVQQIIRQEIPLPEIFDEFTEEDEAHFFEEDVKFRQWKSTDRCEMLVAVSSRSELVETASKQLSDLIIHDFIACSQRDYVKQLKDELPRNKVVIMMDFSMNYNCLIQSAVQSYHWSPKQATVHPTVIYYKDQENELKHTSIIFISDDLDHDVSLVFKFQEKTIAYVKENFPPVDEIEFVTDGCASQYKSKGYFKNLCSIEGKFGLAVSHSYFATSHGKSQCDADGGSAKRKARIASLQRPLDNQIINATDLFEFLKKEQSDKFHYIFVAKSEVDPLRATHQECMKHLETVPGTRSFHFIKPMPGEQYFNHANFSF